MSRSSATHVIRLREPWDREEVVDPGTHQVTVVRFSRRFGRPTGLTPADRIDLAIDGVSADGQVWLNGESLGEIAARSESARFSVHERLQLRNQLRIELAATLLPVRLGEVRLEIFPLV